MKYLKLTSLLLAIALFFASCDKEDDSPIKTTEGYIVGFDPCNGPAGYVIMTADLKDTLVTYNLPDTLYQFPDSYFANTGGVFPDSARYEFKINFTYRFAKEEEKVISICLHNILPIFDWQIVNNQVIIKSATKY